MTSCSRRAFVGQLGLAPIFLALPRVATAAVYPDRPVRIVVGFPPGGLADVLARLIGTSLSAQLGRPFVTENRPGAGTNIAAEYVARAAPDGYTLLLVSTSNAINASLYEGLRFNFATDFEPVAMVTTTPGVMVVTPSFPAHTVAEFIAYAKAHPGQVNLASAGIGSPPQIYGEMFKMMAGIAMTHIPYNGSPEALKALMGGEVDVMFDTAPTSVPHIKSGELRALAVTARSRLETLPDVPALGEFLPGYEASGWQGIAAPKGTPGEIVATLNTAINTALGDPAVRARLDELGSTVAVGSPAEFRDFIVQETDKWARVVKYAGVKVGR